MHPQSLHAEFGHNTDLLCVHRDTLSESGSSTADDNAPLIPTDGEVGVHPSSPYGLGGSVCEDVSRDGTILELVGRLCFPHGRNESIAQAVAEVSHQHPSIAYQPLKCPCYSRTLHLTLRALHVRLACMQSERPRAGMPNRVPFAEKRALAARWRFDGPCHFAIVPATVNGSSPAPLSRSSEPLAVGERITCGARRSAPFGMAGIGISMARDGTNTIMAIDPSSHFARQCARARANASHVVVAINGTLLDQPDGTTRRLEETIHPRAECFELTIERRSEGVLSLRPSPRHHPPPPARVDSPSRMPPPPRLEPPPPPSMSLLATASAAVPAAAAPLVKNLRARDRTLASSHTTYAFGAAAMLVALLLSRRRCCRRERRAATPARTRQ